MKVLFFGSDRVSTLTLQSLLKRSSNLKFHAISPPATRSKTPLAEFHKTCEENNITVTSFHRYSEREDKNKQWDELSAMIDGKFDFGVIASFGQMIPSRVIDAFPTSSVGGRDISRLMVMHPSLLPKYRGSTPI